MSTDATIPAPKAQQTEPTSNGPVVEFVSVAEETALDGVATS